MRTVQLKSMVAVVLVLMLVFSGCTATTPEQAGTTSPETSGSGGTGSAEEPLELVMIAVPGSPFYALAEAGMIAAAEELEAVEVSMVGGATAAVVTETFDKVIASEPDGIITMGLIESLFKEPIDRAMANGIPVFCYDTDLPTSDRIAFFGSDNYEAGVMAGEKMVELLDGKGKIAIIAQSFDTEGSQGMRRSGFEEVIGQYPEMEIVTTELAADLITGADKASQLLTAHPDLNAILTCDGQTVKGVASAVAEKGRAGEIKVVCFDEDEQILDEIIAGNITATVAQEPYEMGYQSTKALVAYIRDGVQCEEINSTECYLVDADNAEEYIGNYR